MNRTDEGYVQVPRFALRRLNKGQKGKTNTSGGSSEIYRYILAFVVFYVKAPVCDGAASLTPSMSVMCVSECLLLTVNTPPQRLAASPF